MDFHDEVMKNNKLTKSDKEMMVVAISGRNKCLYCFVAHGAILRILTKNSRISEEVGINY